MIGNYIEFSECIIIVNTYYEYKLNFKVYIIEILNTI